MLKSLLPLCVLWTGCRPAVKDVPNDPFDYDEPADGVLPLSGSVEGGGRVVCVDPEPRELLGPLERVNAGPDWAAQVPASLDDPLDVNRSAGAVVADLTGDGVLDVFLPHDTACMFFEGRADGELFDASADRIPLAEVDCHAWGASAADVDDDGDLDLLLTREAARDLLWLNDGAGHFVDATAAAGLPDVACGSRSASWGDMDGDGDLDLFIGRHRVILRSELETCEPGLSPAGWELPPGNPNSLLENQGDGTFVDVTAERLTFHGEFAYTFSGGWIDLDGDLSQDLVLINDFGATATPTTAFLNDGTGHFSELPEVSGLRMPIFGMSMATGDINGDGWPDLAVTDIDRLHLMVSVGRLQWVDEAVVRGLRPDPGRGQLASWGVALEDLNHDTRLDLLTVFGPTEGPLGDRESDVLEQPDGLFIQDTAGDFVDRGPAWGFDSTAVGRGLVVADVDGDGWLDVLRPDYRGGPAELLRQRCGSAAWATVRFDGPLDGMGVRLEVVADGETQVRWHNPTSTFLGSSGPSQVHVGLGSADWLDEVRVYWPDGAVSVARDVATRQHLLAHHPSRTSGR